MHHRVVSRLAQGRRFLLGDAGHLSSPFGAEGLNSGLRDAHDIAWKLALWLGGRARPALLETFEPERLAADGHVLEVSNLVDELVRAAVESARTGVRRSPATPAQLGALARSRCMLDVKYADSPLVGEHLGPGVEAPAVPGPGDRYPNRTALAGTAHHLVLFGAADNAGVERLRRRWRGLLDVVHATGDPGASSRASPACSSPGSSPRVTSGRSSDSCGAARPPPRSSSRRSRADWQPAPTPTTRKPTRATSPRRHAAAPAHTTIDPDPAPPAQHDIGQTAPVPPSTPPRRRPQSDHSIWSVNPATCRSQAARPCARARSSESGRSP
jgi:hypothetical protein